MSLVLSVALPDWVTQAGIEKSQICDMLIYDLAFVIAYKSIAGQYF
jgi:hypothetical protein